MQTLFDNIGLSPLHSDKLFYVDNLAGISSELVTAVSKRADTETFWNDILESSKMLFGSMLQTALCACKDYNHILSTTPKSTLNKSSLETIGLDVESIVILIEDPFFDEFSTLKIKRLVLYPTSNFVADISIINLNDLKEIATKNSVQFKAGRCVIDFEPIVSFENQDSQPLALAIEIETSTEFDVSFKTFLQSESDSDISVTFHKYEKSDPIELLEEIQPIAFVSAELRYNLDAIVDSFASEPALLHVAALICAAQILDEKSGSYRINHYANSRLADSEERKDSNIQQAEKILKQFAPTIVSCLQRASRTPFEPTSTTYSTSSFA